MILGIIIGLALGLTIGIILGVIVVAFWTAIAEDGDGRRPRQPTDAFV